jgi:1-acyl-sn-glycerol-3-phosphate acyltransferase
MYNFEDGSYQSVPVKKTFWARNFPTFTFYYSLFFIVLKASRVARKGLYTDSAWIESSHQVLQALENIGVTIEVSGVTHLKVADGPIIIVGNHMSMMETLLLPGIVQPLKPLTFVVKESLLDYPIFKYVMRSRNPIALTRTNPRQDLKTVMTEGVSRLKNSISIIVFPQTTRSHEFDPSQMSSIGVKLAKKAGVTIVPLALKTDCWENGRKLKDFGKINTNKTAYFAFGEPIVIEGKGGAEQEQINEFISAKLSEWAKVER